MNEASLLKSSDKGAPPYLMLVCDFGGQRKRELARVLVSKHKGYIFIQTDQPIYNPNQKGKMVQQYEKYLGQIIIEHSHLRV